MTDFKVADTLSKKKAAVKKFYANLGADIPTQLGKKEVGARRSLPELIKENKFSNSKRYYKTDKK